MTGVSVCVLPEVGDLLLSISMDCWLSESSVRPAAVANVNDSQEVGEIEYTMRLFETSSAIQT